MLHESSSFHQWFAVSCLVFIIDLSQYKSFIQLAGLNEVSSPKLNKPLNRLHILKMNAVKLFGVKMKLSVIYIETKLSIITRYWRLVKSNELGCASLLSSWLILQSASDDRGSSPEHHHQQSALKGNTTHNLQHVPWQILYWTHL